MIETRIKHGTIKRIVGPIVLEITIAQAIAF
jgi:hypothetical protein